MRSFDLVINCFPNIMHETSFTSSGYIRPQFSGKCSREIGYFERVKQNILLVAIAIAQPSENVEEFRMKARYTSFIGCRFSRFLDLVIDFLTSFCYRFFDTGWMDTTIIDQFFQSNLGHFTSDRIKTGNDNRFRRIVYDKLHSSFLFERSDIATFLTNNLTLDVIGRNSDSRRSKFRHMRTGVLLNHGRHDLEGSLLKRIMSLVFKLGHSLDQSIFAFILDELHEALFSFLMREFGYPLKLGHFFCLQCLSFSLDRFYFFGSLGKLGLFCFQLLCFRFNLCLTLFYPSFLMSHFFGAGFFFRLCLLKNRDSLLLGFKYDFLLLFFRFGDDLSCLTFRGRKFVLG